MTNSDCVAVIHLSVASLLLGPHPLYIWGLFSYLRVCCQMSPSAFERLVSSVDRVCPDQRLEDILIHKIFFTFRCSLVCEMIYVVLCLILVCFKGADYRWLLPWTRFSISSEANACGVGYSGNFCTLLFIGLQNNRLVGFIYHNALILVTYWRYLSSVMVHSISVVMQRI